MNTSATIHRVDTLRGASGLNLLAAAWLIISPFVLTFRDVPNAMWSNVLSGAAVAIIAIARLSAPGHTNWSWANLLLGVWVILSPWALGFRQNGAESLSFNSELVWNNVITGAIIAFLAVLSLNGGHAVPTVEET